MRRFTTELVLAAFFTIGTVAHAGDLTIGDDAPQLDVTKWITGDPVNLVDAKGKGITVVEFWATWCGPCVASVPHLTKLQAKYADKGVRIVGMTKYDDGNTLDMVKRFVKKQGDKLDYAIAFEKESKTYDAFMTAAGETGIPTAFVIDEQGRVAWIGHPEGDLEDTLEEMIAGEFDIELAKKVFEIMEKMKKTWETNDYEKRLELAKEWSKVKPTTPGPHITMAGILRNDMDKPTEALAAASRAFELAKNKPSALISLAERITGDHPEKGFNDLALTAASLAIRQAPNDIDASIALFRVQAAMGNEEEAVKTAGRAMEIVEGDASGLAQLAHVLSTPARGAQCTDLAIKAVELAIAAEPDEAYHLMSKFKILVSCRKDLKAARGVGTYLIQKAADDDNLLNEFAWELLTDEQTKGQFNDLALEAAERCHKVSEGTKWMYLDTLALAKFETGARDEAIELQKKAIVLMAENPATEQVLDQLLRFAGATDTAPTKD